MVLRSKYQPVISTVRWKASPRPHCSVAWLYHVSLRYGVLLKHLNASSNQVVTRCSISGLTTPPSSAQFNWMLAYPSHALALCFKVNSSWDSIWEILFFWISSVVDIGEDSKKLIHWYPMRREQIAFLYLLVRAEVLPVQQEEFRPALVSL